MLSLIYVESGDGDRIHTIVIVSHYLPTLTLVDVSLESLIILERVARNARVYSDLEGQCVSVNTLPAI